VLTSHHISTPAIQGTQTWVGRDRVRATRPKGGVREGAVVARISSQTKACLSPVVLQELAGFWGSFGCLASAGMEADERWWLPPRAPVRLRKGPWGKLLPESSRLSRSLGISSNFSSASFSSSELGRPCRLGLLRPSSNPSCSSNVTLLATSSHSTPALSHPHCYRSPLHDSVQLRGTPTFQGLVNSSSEQFPVTGRDRLQWRGLQMMTGMIGSNGKGVGFS
jgi:hypothetical protein